MERDPIMFERLRMAVGMAKTAATAVSNPSAELLRELETLDAAMEDGRIAVYKQPPVDLDDIMVPVDQPDFGLSFKVKVSDPITRRDIDALERFGSDLLQDAIELRRAQILQGDHPDSR